MRSSLVKNLYTYKNNIIRTSSCAGSKQNLSFFYALSKNNFFVLNKIPQPISQLVKFQIADFAKKPEKNDKKVKTQKEKETINKEYQDVSVDELKSKYKSKSDGIVVTYKEVINEIRVQRSNPKILDSVQVNIKGKKNKLSDISTIMLKAANVLSVNPFDEAHKDAIIKSIESSKLDVQITTDGSSVVVTLGAIPDDMKNESLQKVKKLTDAAKEDFKTLRHSMVAEIKKLEKILGQDEAKRIEKGLSEVLEK